MPPNWEAPDAGSSIAGQGMRVLGVAIREEKWIFTLAVIGSAVYGFTTVASANVLGRVTDAVVLPAFRDGRVGYGALVAGIAAILGVAALKVFGIIGRRVWAGIMQYRLQATYRRRLTRQYLRLPLSWHHRHPTGQLLSNANADVESAWMPIAPLPMAVGVVVMLLTSVVAMLVTDLVLSLVGLLVFPAIALLNIVYQRRLAPLAARAQQLRAEVSEIAHESFDGALVVKTLGREEEEAARFGARAEELRDANVRVGRVRGLFDPVLEALPTFGVLAVLAVGSVRVAAGAMPAGDLVQVAYLFTLLAFPIRALGWVLGDLSRSVVGWNRIRSVLDATGAAPHGDRTLTGDGAAAVRMEGVAFSYTGPGADVLHDVDLAVPPGRTVAVVGPTGAGKSTLAQLMVRLVDPGAGRVTLDGVDARELARTELPRATALVPQQTYLFDDTVRGNVALGLDETGEVSDDDVWAALRVAQAERFVKALPDGLDTRVGERGATLSGGQRQRIALARAVVRRPRLLVLDDATSAVDPRVEARILAALRDTTAGGKPVSVVVVAYRKATIALADEVVYVDRGRIAATGPHADLLTREPGYRALVEAYERDAEERAEQAAGGDEEAVA